MSLQIGLLVVRVLLGAAIASHGAQKLFGWFGGYGIKGTGGFFETLGFRPGTVFAAAAGTSEFLGGVLLALGLFGPVGPTLILATMLVAVLTVHIKNGFFASNNGYEMPLIYALGALSFAFAGPGLYSLDAQLGLGWFSEPLVIWIALALGVVGAFGNVAVRKAPSAPAASAN
jgi:putative oxidoreductase